MSETIKGFCTRYAITAGIFPVECEPSTYRPKEFVRAPGMSLLKIGVDFHRTMEQAEAAAREMAEKKIALLSRQLEKLNRLRVSPKWRTEKP